MDGEVHLQIAFAPVDQTKMISELDDDEPMGLGVIGPKHYILAIVEALASFQLDDEIGQLLDS